MTSTKYKIHLSSEFIRTDLVYSRDRSRIKQCKKTGFLDPLLDICWEFPSNLPA